MKKLINDPKSAVREMLEGILAISPHLVILSDENVVLRSDIPDKPDRKVAIISGGGAGHEPAHAGYVGKGMLSAAVVGDVFTSPSTDAVLAAIRSVAGPAGAVLIVKNYTGDRLNFGLAAEIARDEGIPTEVVVVADDAALAHLVPSERRRGIAGTVFIHKLAGAAAEMGMSLGEVAGISRRASSELRSMGVGLGSCIVPALGQPTFSLGETEIELGLGIHGEKGVKRTTIKPADEIVEDILDALISELKAPPGSRLAVLVNGLGATPQMELAIVLRHTLKSLASRGFDLCRAWCGNFMTALEMPGMSISVMLVDDRRLDLLDAPNDLVAWQGSGRLCLPIKIVDSTNIETTDGAQEECVVNATLQSVCLSVADALEAEEAYLSDLDSKAGDGDLGASMSRGAWAIRNLPPKSFTSPEMLLQALGHAVRRAIAGSSGPFYATALLRAAGQMRGLQGATEKEWRNAFAVAVGAIGDLGGAKRGDRTMLDALLPALDAWQAAALNKDRLVFKAAAMAAAAGADASANMIPRLGRASYMGDRALGVPDGGAVAVSIWMAAIERAIE